MGVHTRCGSVTSRRFRLSTGFWKIVTRRRWWVQRRSSYMVTSRSGRSKLAPVPTHTGPGAVYCWGLDANRYCLVITKDTMGLYRMDESTRSHIHPAFSRSNHSPHIASLHSYDCRTQCRDQRYSKCNRKTNLHRCTYSYIPPDLTRNSFENSYSGSPSCILTQTPPFAYIVMSDFTQTFSTAFLPEPNAHAAGGLASGFESISNDIHL
jgi:hypothetical protein